MSGVWIAYNSTVIIVDDTIIVQVLETDVTRLCTRLDGMSIDLGLVLENTIGNVAIEYVDGIVTVKHGDVRVINLVDIIRNAAVQILNLILVVRVRQV